MYIHTIVHKYYHAQYIIIYRAVVVKNKLSPTTVAAYIGRPKARII